MKKLYSKNKLTKPLANQMRSDKLAGATNKELAEKYRVSPTAVSKIINNKLHREDV